MVDQICFFKEFVCDKKQQKNTRRPSGFDFFPGGSISHSHVLFAACVDERNEDNHTGVDRIYHLESR